MLHIPVGIHEWSLSLSEKDLKVYKRTDFSFYQLYDLEEDAAEKNNLIHQRPEIRKDLIYKMTSILEKGRVSLSPSERVLSSQMAERMMNHCAFTKL